MPRLWYPERFHVEVVCHKLAGHIFATEEWPLPVFAFLGGAKGEGLLESALALPRQSFAGRYFYKTWDEKAGVLLRSIVKNHPLIDGNKRIGLATTIVFLLMNGRFLLARNEDMVQFAVSIADDERPSWRKIGRWIKERAIPAERMPRMIARVKQQHPERTVVLDDVTTSVTAFARWARNYRQIENEVRRECRRLGIDPAVPLEYVAERAIA